MSSRTEQQRAKAITEAETVMKRHFHRFREEVDLSRARRMARLLGIEAEFVVGQLADDAWATCHATRPLVTMRSRVPRHIVLHELAHVRLLGRRVTDHGLKFLDEYQGLVWTWYGDKSMSRAFEAALQGAR